MRTAVALLVLSAGCRTILGIEDGIIDEPNPNEPVVGFETAMTVVDEASGLTNINVQLSFPSEQTVTVKYTLAGGTAQPSADFDLLSAPTVTFPPGETVASIQMSITADADEEPDEDIQLELGSATGATLDVGASTHEVSILSNIAPRVQFLSPLASGQESAASPMVTLGLSTTATTTASVEIDASGTATVEADYNLSSKVVTFVPGETTKQVPLAIVEDLLDEDDENVTLTLARPTGILVGSTSTHTYTIQDDDPQPTIAFTTPNTITPEPLAATINATVSLSAASGKMVAVSLTIGGTATLGVDYQIVGGVGALSLTFSPGQTQKTVGLTVIHNAGVEFDETVTLTFGTPTNASLGAATTFTLTIDDTD